MHEFCWNRTPLSTLDLSFLISPPLQDGCVYVFGGVVDVNGQQRSAEVYRLWLEPPSLSLAAIAQEAGTVDATMVAQAEWIAGIELSESERDEVANSLQRSPRSPRWSTSQCRFGRTASRSKPPRPSPSLLA